MARGWESKSVEAQQEAATTTNAAPKPRLSPEAAARLRQKEGLLLSRQRVLQQLEASENPRHRRMLESALAGLDAQLGKIS